MGIIKVAIDMLKDSDPEIVLNNDNSNANNTDDPFVIKTITEGFSLHDSNKSNTKNK